MAGLTHADLDVRRLTTRPRKVLAYRTPTECLQSVWGNVAEECHGRETRAVADLKRSQPEPPPVSPRVRWKLGLADELLNELAPLLAGHGIDIHDRGARNLDTSRWR